MKTIKMQVMGGEHIDHAEEKALRLAKKHKCRVDFTFNDVKLHCTPKKSAKALCWEYDLCLGQRHETYRQSPAGQLARISREEEIKRKQAEIDRLLKTGFKHIAIGNMDNTMQWIKTYAENSDDTGVKWHGDKAIKLLEDAGFQRNDLVGNRPSYFTTKHRLGRYIAGQCLDCLYRGMPPHPLAITFIERDYTQLDK